ncbi:N-acetylglucosaminyl transferase component-domain-containing protein [Daedaleopsis nitida]|nr:N-acetylglucosaminyl transferase component-domain-containing protein [Daedaleopsis nitida]
MKASIVLWPTDLSPEHGICYGWSQPLLCVAGILPLSEQLEADLAISSAIAHPKWAAVRGMFSSDPHALGYCTQAARNHDPRIAIFPGVKSAENLQYVLYRRHRRQSMRFYSFNFSELDILPQHEVAELATLGLNNHFGEAALLADPTRHLYAAPGKGSVFDGEVLSQVNLAHFLSEIVNGEIIGRRASPSQPGTPDMVMHRRRQTVPPTVSTSDKSLATTYQSTIQASYTLARMFSTAAEQFDVRYEQGVYVSREVAHVYHGKARTVQSISKYIKFHNCVWLVLNDVIIGVAFGSFLCENQQFFARYLHHGLQTYLVDGLQCTLVWLNNWPAGLKLNTELSQFYCHSLVGGVSAWGWILKHAAPHFPALIWLIGAMGCCGMTMIVSLLSDALTLLTAHLYVCYYVSATIFSHQLSLAGSLWNLFRGKRYNVLRNRIDRWDYDLDQLLLGTILFTLLAFLYPTTLTYYALFATARLVVIVCHAVFDTVTALLNHFPLFALLLRIKDPLRLPGGVCVKRSRTGFLTLASQPAPLSSIFRHYAHLVGRLATHYHPLRMLRQLASGKILNPIPRASIRYSMIPTEASAKRH